MLIKAYAAGKKFIKKKMEVSNKPYVEAVYCSLSGRYRTA